MFLLQEEKKFTPGSSTSILVRENVSVRSTSNAKNNYFFFAEAFRSFRHNSKLAVTVFTSLVFQTLSPNWL